MDVDVDPTGSNHLPVRVAVSLRIDTIRAFSYKIKIPKNQYKAFSRALMLSADSLQKDISNISDSNTLAQYELFKICTGSRLILRSSRSGISFSPLFLVLLGSRNYNSSHPTISPLVE